MVARRGQLTREAEGLRGKSFREWGSRAAWRSGRETVRDDSGMVVERTLRLPGAFRDGSEGCGRVSGQHPGEGCPTLLKTWTPSRWWKQGLDGTPRGPPQKVLREARGGSSAARPVAVCLSRTILPCGDFFVSIAFLDLGWCGTNTEKTVYCMMDLRVFCFVRQGLTVYSRLALNSPRSS